MVLPVHNEAGTIGPTLREFHDVVAKKHAIPIRFVVCEDGSSDGSADVIRGLAAELPIKLISDPGRKGYSRAAIDGLRATEAEVVGFIDSDGQCDPEDMPAVLAALESHDLVVGRRSPRIDHWSRLLMSWAFKGAYRLLFPIKLSDPSCPYLLITRPALHRILQGDIGILKQGFWWEFQARAAAAGLRIVEVPVRHRAREGGGTRVYQPTRVPGIAAAHLLGLLKLRRELRASGAAARRS